MADPLLLLALLALAVGAVLAYRRWGWPGVAAVFGSALGLVLAALGSRRAPRPVPPRVIDETHRREVDAAQADYQVAQAQAVELDERIEGLTAPVTDDERAARRAAREAEVRARGGR